MRAALLQEKVLIVLRWSADCLARIVDDDVEAREGGLDVRAEALELSEVTEVEPKAVQPMLPAVEICTREGGYSALMMVKYFISMDEAIGARGGSRQKPGWKRALIE